MNILIFIIILLVLVLVHEFGHFFSAKKFGIRVDEFGFGFPPKLFGIKKGETEYSINLLPIGGFVKIFGETPDDENMNGIDKDRSFVNKPKYQQAIVLFAGIFANFLLAWLLFSVGFMSGLPISVGSEPEGYEVSNAHLVVVSVLADSPAEKGGLKSGDKIISVQSGYDFIQEVNPDALKSFIISHREKEIEIAYVRGSNSDSNVAHITKIIPTKSSLDEKPSIGIAMDEIGTLKLPILSAFWEGLKLDWSVTKGTVVGLYTLIQEGIMGKGSFSSVTGPVGMVGIVGDAYQFGFVYLLSFAALISVNLAIINLIPFPALDGGRLLFLLIEKIKGSPINPKFANNANMIGFAILIILMLFVTYHDIIKL
ncbi:RIP metalloprotease RseP [Candidatus Nomurabacteria bacterium CG_4_9_14_0_2_um_filter_32_10]|uniref:Zinc metalloprotease n=2 Tax=Candidatus Nomuraibacteriota TaxID=1752729 RepID=A0A2J0MEL0_9BACT|nr:MAG: RIP metalloprotease RseP [Candidatus Nomurabacteria bacterium CG_4_10_14_0_2_um_filter_33_9]PJC49207.1 MAG: RIP metalloprotease RseP [Candidatus Nomurabacteria bacterium CG_4_9_14_0_2_um_filter_32_10]